MSQYMEMYSSEIDVVVIGEEVLTLVIKGKERRKGNILQFSGPKCTSCLAFHLPISCLFFFFFFKHFDLWAFQLFAPSVLILPLEAKISRDLFFV